MSKRKCAAHKIAPALLIIILLAPASSRADETIVSTVTVNQENKGEFFVVKKSDGDFLVKTTDLSGMGLAKAKGETSNIDGEEFLSLKSVKEIGFAFSEREVTLEIIAEPTLFPKATINFTPQRQPNVYYTKDTSAFLNYAVDHRGNDTTQKNLTVSNELGIKFWDILLYSDSTYSLTDTDNRFARLMSNVTYDRRDEMIRIVAGDFYASSSDLGSTSNIGGISYSKIYNMNPYFVRYPMINFKGVASAPSDIEVYRNGVLIRRERINPGEFELANTASYGGAGTLETVIRDPFGREQHINQPYYFTNILLGRDLHEYSYNIGFLRDNFGIDSADYDDFAFSGFHRYGITNHITLGIASEGGNDRFNTGPQGSFLVGRAGTLTLLAAGSLDYNGLQPGGAGSARYEYQGRTNNAWAFFNAYTRDYKTVNSVDAAIRTMIETGGGAGYTTMKSGSISVEVTDAERYDAVRAITGSVTYSKSIIRDLFGFATYRIVDEGGISHEAFVGLNYYPGKDLYLSANYQRSESSDSGVVQLQKSPPYGEGLGYKATLGGTENAFTLNPAVQYNSKYGIHRGEYTGSYTGDNAANAYQLSTSGSIAYVGGAVNLTRPINDSFGLVKVDGLKDVDVFVSNQNIGKTGKSGKLFIPNLNSYYDNQVSVAADEVPIDYTISDVTKYVSPSFRSGSVVDFEVRKVQAVNGFIWVKLKKQVIPPLVIPLEFYEIALTSSGGEEVIFPTGRDGEFYVEDLKPGKYTGRFEFKGEMREFEMTVPESEEIIIKTDRIICR